MSTTQVRLSAEIDDELLTDAHQAHDDETVGVTLQRALELYRVLDNPHEVLAAHQCVETPPRTDGSGE
jgi:hypothetical protein